MGWKNGKPKLKPTSVGELVWEVLCDASAAPTAAPGAGDGASEANDQFPVRCANNRTPHRYGPECSGEIEVVTDEPSPAPDAGNVAPGEPRGEPQVKYLDAETFRNEGYLQEANRGFFHPLGLALELGTAENIFSATAVLRVWDFRDDPEGIRFEGVDLVAHAVHLAELREARRPARETALGYWQQPAQEKAPYSPPVLTEFTTFTNIGGDLLCSRCKADFDFIDWNAEHIDEDEVDYPAFCPKCGRSRAPEINAPLPAVNTPLPEGGLPTAADLDAVEAERKRAGQS